MLMSVGAPLPKKVYGHGWLNCSTARRCPSPSGNVVDPYVLAERYGVDALRFFLLRTFPFGSDGNFTNELLIQHASTLTWPTRWATWSPAPRPWPTNTSAANWARAASTPRWTTS